MLTYLTVSIGFILSYLQDWIRVQSISQERLWVNPPKDIVQCPGFLNFCVLHNLLFYKSSTESPHSVFIYIFSHLRLLSGYKPISTNLEVQNYILSEFWKFLDNSYQQRMIPGSEINHEDCACFKGRLILRSN